MWFGEKNSEKIGAKVKKNNHCSNIHNKGAKINKGGKIIIILWDGENRKLLMSKGKKTDFERSDNKHKG